MATETNLTWNRSTTELRYTATLLSRRVAALCESKCGWVCLVRVGQVDARAWNIFLGGKFICETTGLATAKTLASACLTGDVSTCGVLTPSMTTYVNRLLAA